MEIYCSVVGSATISGKLGERSPVRPQSLKHGCVPLTDGFSHFDWVVKNALVYFSSPPTYKCFWARGEWKKVI